jgi:hypothetical protein
MQTGALYVPAEENEYFPVVGFQQSFRFRTDIQVMEPGSDPKVMEKNIRLSVVEGRSLYVTRKWPLPAGWRYEPRGPLLRVTSEPLSSEAGKEPKTSPEVSWERIGFSSVCIKPSEVQAGGWAEIDYNWVRQGKSAADESRALIALFVDDEGNYLLKNGVHWLHDIHALSPGWISLMKPGRMYTEKRILFIPSDFPPGHYRLAVGLQKNAPERVKGTEAFNLEFYEREEEQNLQKFMGRGGEEGLIQSSPLTTQGTAEGLRMVTQSAKPLRDPRFAVVAELDIVPGAVFVSNNR